MNTSTKGSNKKLLSIISASNRPHNMQAFLENLQETIEDPAAIEVLVKIDDGDTKMQQLLSAAITKFPFEIRFIQTPKLDGYYTLHYGYQQLFEMSDPQTYFILPINEEVRFKTFGWDNILRKYIGLFSDDLFRLKISKLRHRNYYSYHDCGPCPENYPIFTRKWMELAEGIGDCWGPDGWHQFIDYHLGVTPGLHGIPGLFRSPSIMDIQLGGEEAGRELTPEQARIRTRRICREWWRMYSPAIQQRFRRLAFKMYCYTWAKANGFDEYKLVDKTRQRSMQIYTKEGIKVAHFDYYLSPYYIKYKNFCFLIRCARRSHFGFLREYIYHHNIPKNFLIRYIDRAIRALIVGLAFILGLFTLDFYSHRKSLTKRLLARAYHFSIRVTKFVIKLFIGKKTAKKLAKYVRKLRKVEVDAV